MNISSPDFNLCGIDHIIFDKDGTITDANLYWGEIIRRRSVEILLFYDLDSSDQHLRRSLESAMGLGPCGSLLPEGPIAIKSRTEVIRKISHLLTRLDVASSPHELSEIFKTVHARFMPYCADYSPLIPGVRDFINSVIAHGCSISLATSDSYENTRYILKHYQLLDHFEHIVCSDSGYGDKITGMPALHLCKKLNKQPANTICIGDTFMDYNMSCSAGLLECILVATGQIPYDTLKSHSIFAVESLDDLVLS